MCFSLMGILGCRLPILGCRLPPACGGVDELWLTITMTLWWLLQIDHVNII